MPELPEVEAMRTWLELRIMEHGYDKVIERIEVLRGKYLQGVDLDSFKGKHLSHPWRAGKFLGFSVTDGLCLIGNFCAHNAMSGYWDLEGDQWTFDYVEGRRKISDKDVRVKIYLRDNTLREEDAQHHVLRFHDARLFGSLRYYTTKEGVVPTNKLGPDLFLMPSKCINALQTEAFKHPKRPIKDALMDQNVVAGAGNIYAAEACFMTGVRPDRMLSTLTPRQIENLVDNTGVVFRRALRFDLNYKRYLQVYRESNCKTCNAKISCCKIKGRSSYFCPECQK